MPRITGNKIRQMIWKPGEYWDGGTTLDRLELFNEDGTPADLSPGPPGPGFIWRGDWIDNTAYVPNDVVRSPSDGNLYISITEQVSGVPPEADAPNWNLYVEKGPQGIPGVQWAGEWVNTEDYVKNDLVREDTGVYILTANELLANATPPSADSVNWDVFIPPAV